ncbi:MAG: helix-turn-helix domain-containing protein [Hyphomicrobiales bacterium]
MNKAQKEPSRLSRAILEMAGDMRKGGLLDAAGHAKIVSKITKRELGRTEATTVAPVTADDVKAIRERANMSQAVLAHYLNVTVGYVSQLERGVKRPTGPALALLNVIRRKGIEAIL